MGDRSLTAVGFLKIALCFSVVILGGCRQNDTASKMAEARCEARGLSPASEAYKTCRAQSLDAIYHSWGRDRVDKGD